MGKQIFNIVQGNCKAKINKKKEQSEGQASSSDSWRRSLCRSAIQPETWIGLGSKHLGWRVLLAKGTESTQPGCFLESLSKARTRKRGCVHSRCKKWVWTATKVKIPYWSCEPFQSETVGGWHESSHASGRQGRDQGRNCCHQERQGQKQENRSGGIMIPQES